MQENRFRRGEVEGTEEEVTYDYADYTTNKKKDSSCPEDQADNPHHANGCGIKGQEG